MKTKNNSIIHRMCSLDVRDSNDTEIFVLLVDHLIEDN